MSSPLVMAAAVVGWLGLSSILALAQALPSEPVLLKDLEVGLRVDGVVLKEAVSTSAKTFLVIEQADQGMGLWAGQVDGSGLTEISPGQVSGMTVSGERVFFVRSGHLWVSDGTEAGTLQLTEPFIVPGREVQPPYPRKLHVFSDGVAFNTSVGSLSLSDGTREGTRSWMGNAKIGGVVHGQLIYAAFVNSTAKIWKTDGTQAGTMLVKDLAPGKESLLEWQTQVGNQLYFQASINNSQGYPIDQALWKTDGTTKGTVKLKESSLTEPVTEVDGKTYFVGYTEKTGDEVWVTNGTAAGTRVLFETQRGPASNEIQSLLGVNGKLFVKPGWGSSFIYDLATRQITLPALPLDPPPPQITETRNPMQGPNGTVIFNTDNTKLWSTDGTHAGTRLVSPASALAPGGVAAYAGSHGVTGGAIFFIGGHSAETFGLWRTDGTETGLTKIRSFSRMTYGSLAEGGFRASDGWVYFSAYDNQGKYQLWRTDGTPEGTRKVQNVTTSSNGPSYRPFMLLEHNGLIYFRVSNELWRTDGTAVGTFSLGSLGRTTRSTFPIVMGDRVYYQSDALYYGQELSSTDGTVAGTRRLKDIYPSSSSDPDHFFTHQGKLYFSARTFAEGREPWVTDGTEAGTRLLANLTTTPSAFSDTVVRAFGSVGHWLYANTATGLHRMNPNDGPNPQFTRVAEAAGNFLGVPEGISGLTSGLYFYGWQNVANVKQYGLFLDLGPGQTPRLLKTVTGQSYDAFQQPQNWPNQISRIGNRVIFQDAGRLFTTDGTVAGTIALQTDVSVLKVLATTASFLYFTDNQSLYRVRPDGSGYSALLGHESGIYTIIEATDAMCLFAHKPTYQNTHELWISQGSPETARQLTPPGMELALGDSTFVPGVAYLPGPMFSERVVFQGKDETSGTEPRMLILGGHLQLTQSQASGLTNVQDGQTLEFPALLTGQSHSLNLRLANAGLRPLTEVMLSGPSLAHYSLTPSLPSTLEAGQIVELTLTYTPQQGGLHEDAVEITALADGQAQSLTLPLKGQAVSATDVPAVLTAPASHLLRVGESATLSPELLSPAGATYTWDRDGEPLESTTPELNLPTVTLADAGTYTLTTHNGAASATVPPAYVGVIQPSDTTDVYAVPGEPITLTCTTAGPGLSYRWKSGYYLLFDSEEAQGTDTPELTLPASNRYRDYVIYQCLVTLQTPTGPITRSAGEIRVFPLPVPNPHASAALHSFIGEEFQFQVQVNTYLEGRPAAWGFTAKGLPPGLKISPTGLITGRPTKAGHYEVDVAALNEAGKGNGALVIDVHPLLTANTYHSLLSRQPALDEGRGLGGAVRVTLTNTGSVTGQVICGGETFRFTKITTFTRLPSSGDTHAATVQVVIPRNKRRSALCLTLNADRTVTLHDQENPEGGLAEGHLLSQHYPPGAQRDYTALIGYPETPARPEATPKGAGFFTAKISKNGLVTWKGKLADGSTLAGSSPLLENTEIASFEVRQVVLHHTFFKGTASVQGMLEFMAFFEDDSYVSLRGTLDWMKAPQDSDKDRVYQAGIPRHDVSITGMRYWQPLGDDYLLGAAATPDNLKLTLSQGGLTNPIEQLLTVDERHRLTLPPRASAPPVPTFKINMATGLITGSLVLDHENPKLKRTVPLQGVITRKHAAGFFLLPALPEEAGETLKNTAMESGLFKVEATP